MHPGLQFPQTGLLGAIYHLDRLVTNDFSKYVRSTGHDSAMNPARLCANNKILTLGQGIGKFHQLLQLALRFAFRYHFCRPPRALFQAVD